MPKSRIVTIPSPQLRAPNKPLTSLDKKTLDLLKLLRAELLLSGGVGLAAPQIGLNYRVFATDLRRVDPDFPQNADPIRFFINPVITAHSPRQTFSKETDGGYTLEGCLSLPGLYAPVPRWKDVELDYLEPNFTTGELINQHSSFSDYFARNIQHELDHLDGVLFTDYLKNNDLILYRDNKTTHQLEEIDKNFIYGY